MAKQIRLDFALNHQQYDLEPSNYNLLCNEINQRMFFAFCRPLDNGERMYIRSTYQESVNKVIQQNEKQKQEGLSLPSFFGGKKKE
jgi:hypothetical protein